MGISERKEREKEEMKKLIIDTATRLFIEQGFDKTSMRSIAEAMEYSPATIYLYFKDKSELFDAIHRQGFKVFFEYLSQVNTIEDPMERLNQLGIQYLTFAIENPGYYDLMLIMREPMSTQRNEESWDQGDTSHKILTTTVEECVSKGHFRGNDPAVVSFMIWSQVHGICSMMIRDRMKFYPEEQREELMFAAKKVFMDMVRSF
ncbi:MAG: helix-turn-helix transcriptional regulator [Roseivirga sp.]|nr:helix-turn-helix transcriptional regulator [Roseivirga sp.]